MTERDRRDHPSLTDFDGLSDEDIARLPEGMRRVLQADRTATELAKIDPITADLTSEVAIHAFEKHVWGEGPWVGEPDLVMWMTKAPPHYRCQVLRCGFGNLCGYVAIPAEHPLHGRHYSTVRGLPAHRGLTFSGPATHGHWVFGFDCAHGFDIKPAMDARDRRRGWLPMHEMPSLNDPEIFPPALRLQYRDLAYVRAWVDALAAALGAIARGVVRLEDLMDADEE